MEDSCAYISLDSPVWAVSRNLFNHFVVNSLSARRKKKAMLENNAVTDHDYSQMMMMLPAVDTHRILSQIVSTELYKKEDV